MLVVAVPLPVFTGVPCATIVTLGPTAIRVDHAPSGADCVP